MACTGCNSGCDDCGGLNCGTGPAGLDGLNAFTTTTATFVQPAYGASAINISVSAVSPSTGIWAGVGQWVFIEGAGFFKVVTSTTVLLTVIVPSVAIQTYNYTLSGSGSTIAIGKGVSPAGIEGAAGAAGATGGNGIFVLDVDHDYATNTKNANAYSSTKTTPIPASTIGAIDDIIRIEMDVIGDETEDIIYGVKVEFDGNIMLELDGYLYGGRLPAIKLTIDLIVTATNTIIPYVTAAFYKSGFRTYQSLFLVNNEVSFYDPSSSASITLNSGTKNIITYLKASGSGNNVSITSYKVYKLLKA
tara:strand:- start:1371 stop:2282 length:912 start_codon:yes stop_codon:yes gene_type:complete